MTAAAEADRVKPVDAPAEDPAGSILLIHIELSHNYFIFSLFAEVGALEDLLGQLDIAAGSEEPSTFAARSRRGTRHPALSEMGADNLPKPDPQTAGVDNSSSPHRLAPPCRLLVAPATDSIFPCKRSTTP